MAGKRQRKNGTWEYVFKRAGVLEKPLYMTFHSEEQGDAYAKRLEALLDKGIIPMEYQRIRAKPLREIVRKYQREAHPSKKDMDALTVTVRKHGDMGLASITSKWVDMWIASMKRIEQLAPSTIRARVGALARCTDWAMRKGYVQFPDHPLRSLPHGYAQYSKADIAFTGVARKDKERDRRLEPGEEQRILEIIETGVLPRKHRPYKLPHTEALKCMFILAVESAMRLREIYTLSKSQVDLRCLSG